MKIFIKEVPEYTSLSFKQRGNTRKMIVITHRNIRDYTVWENLKNIEILNNYLKGLGN